MKKENPITKKNAKRLYLLLDTLNYEIDEVKRLVGAYWNNKTKLSDEEIESRIRTLKIICIKEINKNWLRYKS